MIQELPIEIGVPLSVTAYSTHEIIFFGVRDIYIDYIIVYNTILDEYKILNDKQNYKAIGVKIQGHCIFKHNTNNNYNNINSLEYISFDTKHITLYSHIESKMYKLKLNYLNKDNNDHTGLQFSSYKPLCVSFLSSNTNTHCMLLYKLAMF